MYIRFCCYFQRFGVHQSFFSFFSCGVVGFPLVLKALPFCVFFIFFVFINALLLVLLLLPPSARKKKEKKKEKRKRGNENYIYISLFVLFQFPFPRYTESPTPALHFSIAQNGRSHSTLKSGGPTRRPIRHFRSTFAACCGPLGFRV